MLVYVEIKKDHKDMWSIVWQCNNQVIGYVYPKKESFIVTVHDWAMATICKTEEAVIDWLADNE